MQMGASPLLQSCDTGGPAVRVVFLVAVRRDDADG